VVSEGLTKGTSVSVGQVLPLGTDASKGLQLVEYKERWQQERSSEGTRGKMPNGIKLLWGVFSHKGKESYETVIGNTWVRQEGVCVLKNDHQLKNKRLKAKLSVDCHVYVAFVKGGGRESHLESSGHIVLKVDDSAFGAKSFEYFKFAAKQFPWATHLAQMDLNTYPDMFNWHKAIFNLATKQVGCESYIAGPFRAMSRRLALGVSRPGGVWDTAVQGVQGAVDGLETAINNAKDSVCVSTRHLK